jgi:hypothetical protein
MRIPHKRDFGDPNPPAKHPKKQTTEATLLDPYRMHAGSCVQNNCENPKYHFVCALLYIISLHILHNFYEPNRQAPSEAYLLLSAPDCAEQSPSLWLQYPPEKHPLKTITPLALSLRVPVTQ